MRSDLDVKVNPSALLLNGVDLIKPMNSGQLIAALGMPSVDTALDQAVVQIFTTEFADGLVNGKVTAAKPHRLSGALSFTGKLASSEIFQRAAVLLKDSGILPLGHAPGHVSVIADNNLPNTCAALATSLAHQLGTTSSCTNDSRVALPSTVLFQHLPDTHGNATRTVHFRPTSRGRSWSP